MTQSWQKAYACGHAKTTTPKLCLLAFSFVRILLFGETERDVKTQALRFTLWVGGATIGLPLIYCLSLGPVGWLVSRGLLPDAPLHAVYRPLMATSFLCLDGLSERYYNWWVPPKPFYCGGTGDIVTDTTDSTTTSTNR